MKTQVKIQNQARPAEIVTRVLDVGEGDEVPQKGTLINIPRANPDVDVWQVIEVKEVSDDTEDTGPSRLVNIDDLDQNVDDADVRAPAGLLSPSVDSQQAYEHIVPAEDVDVEREKIDADYNAPVDEDGQPVDEDGDPIPTPEDGEITDQSDNVSLVGISDAEDARDPLKGQPASDPLSPSVPANPYPA